MADMFPGSSSLGESVGELFADPKTSPNAIYTQIQRENRINAIQNQGVRDMPSENGNDAQKNSPQYGNEKNKSSATADPMEVEAQWTARMAKFAGIAQGTGVKLGGL